jgi:hypothetical protein
MTTAEEAAVAWRAENADLVRRALSLIEPERQWHDACIEDIEMAIVELQLDVSQLRNDTIHNNSKLAKRAARRLADALRRVEVVLKDKNLDASVHLSFPRNKLRGWIERCDEKARTPSRKSKRTTAEAKRLAVMRACLLLFKHGTSGAADDAARGSRFCRLAALLYGDPKVDLHNQCAAYLRDRKKWGPK